MNEVKPEDRCSIPDEVLWSLIDRTMEILLRHGLIPDDLPNPFDEQKDTE